MTNKQEDFLSMSQTTIAMLYENDIVWKDNQPLADTINDINGINEQIIDLQAQQLVNNAGIAGEKKSYRESMQDSIIAISGILAFYAAAVKNADLQEQINLNPRALKRTTGLQFIGIANMVADAGKSNLAGASVYGLTQSMLDSLSTNQNNFIKILNAPRNARAAKAQATAMLASLIATLRTEINGKLDKAMVLYKNNTGFYDLYKRSRTIVSSPTHHMALMVKVTDGEGKPLAGARIIIANGKEKVLRKTSPLGNIRVQNLHDGDYVMTIEKKGYETQQIAFVIAPPATTKLQVVMK